MCEFSWRASLLDSTTGVLIIQNKSPEWINQLKIHLEDQTTFNLREGKNTRTTDYAPPGISPKGTIEIGIKETGWLLKAGTTVTISLAGYEDKTLYFYNDDKSKLQMAKSWAEKKANQIEKIAEKAAKEIQ